MKIKNKYTILLICSLMWLSPAFKNAYPFLYADTGTYLSGGFLGIVSPLRPIFYGLFIRHASLFESFWLVVFIQAWIVSWTIFLFFKTFDKRDTRLLTLISVFVLTLFSNFPMFVGMLMPDFLTSTMLLSVIVLFYGKNVSTLNKTACLLLVLFALFSHHSHFYILLFTALAHLPFMIYKAFFKGEKRNLMKYALVFPLMAIGYFGMMGIHYSFNGKMERENASHVFLMNRMVKIGVLDDFLAEKCLTKSYGLCAYQNKIPESFLWDAQSPVNIDGTGWESKREDYNATLFDILSEWKYLKKFGISTVETTIAQFFCFEGKIIFPESKQGSALSALQVVWPQQINQSITSLQYFDKWEHEGTDSNVRLLVFVSLFFVLYLFLFDFAVLKQIHKDIALSMLIFLIGNALICGGISMIDPRFQARVVWLVPLLAFYISSELGFSYFKNKYFAK